MGYILRSRETESLGYRFLGSALKINQKYSLSKIFQKSISLIMSSKYEDFSLP